MSKRKYPPISIHQTLHGQLEINWEQEYQKEYNCPHCKEGKITSYRLAKRNICKLTLQCISCRKHTALTARIPGTGRKHSKLSTHQTLHGQLKVNWQLEYQGEYTCPYCQEGQLKNYSHSPSLTCGLEFKCTLCKKHIGLTQKVPAYICNYRSEIECPNPLCTELNPNKKKGWIYEQGGKNKTNNHKCHFCGVNFIPESTYFSSWVGSQTEDNILPFSFNNDIWDLRNFYDKFYTKTLNFQKIAPQWYRIVTKKYLYYLLKTSQFSSSGYLNNKIVTLRQFGRAVLRQKNTNLSEINRNTIIDFLDICKSNKNRTVNQKLHHLKNFFDWLDLETLYLIRSRDFLKEINNDVDWLDEITRKRIKQHLEKIPAPVACHYLLQAYTAARTRDICEITFDCLLKEDGRYYVKYYEHKKLEWHKIPANREIRKVIEQQQAWIRKNLGKNYPYLFCNVGNIREESYPQFSQAKYLPHPPKNTNQNPMIRIIRMLIEKENILDANGQKPYFTGKITRSSRLQEIRTKYGIEAAQLYANHKSSNTTFQHYAPPTREQVAEVDLPFQELLMNPDNKFLPWQSLPESLLKNPKAYELDLEIAPRLVVYGHCALDPKTPCPVNLYPKCYGCFSFRPSTSKLPLYERQYQGEQQRLTEAEKVGAELAHEEAKATIEAMDKWLPKLRRLANG